MSEDFPTRHRLKLVAMRLFAEQGVEAVTVRQIVAESGAKNGGSLNYYFSTKEGLITELLSDLFNKLTQEWIVRLAQLEQSGKTKTVRDIVAILVDSARATQSGNRHPAEARFLASLLFTRRHLVRDFMEQKNFSVFGYLLNYIRELSPQIPASVMQQRLIFLSWYLISILAACETALSLPNKRKKHWTDVDPLDNLTDTATALIEAPVTASTKSVQIGKVTRTRKTEIKTAKKEERRKAPIRRKVSELL